MLSPGSPWVRWLLPFVGQGQKYTQQHSLIVLADIKPRCEPELRKTLEKIQVRPFHQTKTVHFATWLILPGLKDESENVPGPSKLVLETNYDGDLAAHLKDLVSNCGQAFDEIYAHCCGYPPAGTKDHSTEVRAYLKDRCQRASVYPTAYYIGLPGRTVEDIRNAIDVYDKSKAFIDNKDCHGKDPRAVQEALLDYFSKLDEKSRPFRSPITQKGLRRLAVFNLICAIPIALCLIIPSLWLMCVARWFEKRELREGEIWDPTKHDEDFTHLCLGVQNHLCTYATVKPGRFRMFVVRRALALGRILSSKLFILGKLDQMETVHFIRWVLIERQLLFVGNYDGNYAGYLSDFSDQAWGVNLIWSNTFRFPPTKWLFFDGAKDLQGFEEHALTHYLPAQVFYSAYPQHSLRNILRFLEFRDDLADKMKIIQE